MSAPPAVSVVMPAYGQAAFVPRAVASLLAQERADWELVVVDDGSPDDVAGALPADPRIRLLRRERNGGLGAALNTGLDAARAPVVAYLPCDDVLHPRHLGTLLEVLAGHPGAVAAVAGRDGDPDPAPQLVQVAHRRTPHRWIEREELEGDDLCELLWDRLAARGAFVPTGAVTCAWTAHPGQRHRAIRESCDGGLNTFRARYRIPGPLRFHSSETGLVDEVARHRADRERPDTPMAPDGLRIALAGELAYNPERVLALEERGHALAGVWIRDPLGFNTVGPLPFGHVAELDGGDPVRAVREAGADVAYALLNWRAAPLAHALLDAGVPVVWHFKEAPQRSIARGEWALVAELHERAAGVIYATELERTWFERALPGRRDAATTLVLDGDLPRSRDVERAAAAPLSADDGVPRLALLGRPAGASPGFLGELAAAGVELHVHGLARTPAGREWLGDARRRAGAALHLHAGVETRDWARVLSRYDAGLLHCFRSANGGDLGLARWEDLNMPARVPTLLAGGLPLAQAASPGAVVQTQELVRATGAGVLFGSAEELADGLRAEMATRAARRSALALRGAFGFDAHADRLVAFLRTAASSSSRTRSWERSAG